MRAEGREERVQNDDGIVPWKAEEMEAGESSMLVTEGMNAYMAMGDGNGNEERAGE